VTGLSRNSRRLAASAAVACVVVFSLLFARIGIRTAAASAQATHTVIIDGVKYEPATLTVKRADTVVWVNRDPFPHTVTAKGMFDSHEIPAGKSWKYRPLRAGEYTYICTLHPNMKGTLRVE